MRSRTELVTTTFIDSEEEQTESDDSEEDWRPVSSRNGKKRQSKGKRRHKRKASTAPKLMAKKKMMMEENNKDEAEDSDEDDYQKVYPPTANSQETVEHKEIVKKIEDKPSADKSGIFNLYLYKKDLDNDYKNNSHLCLWRRDGSSLLQKYIRVKTNNCEEFIFTSSSVYSSWDERRRKDFATIGVKCMEDNNRRVTIQDPGVLHILSEEMVKRKLEKTEGVRKADEDSSNEMLDSPEDDGDYDDDEDEEEEMSGDDDDVNSAKSSDDGEDEYYEGEEGDEGSTNEGASHP